MLTVHACPTNILHAYYVSVDRVCVRGSVSWSRYTLSRARRGKFAVDAKNPEVRKPWIGFENGPLGKGESRKSLNEGFSGEPEKRCFSLKWRSVSPAWVRVRTAGNEGCAPCLGEAADCKK